MAAAYSITGRGTTTPASARSSRRIPFTQWAHSAIVPDPGVVIDYNRYLYGRASPMKFNDPSGHEPCSGSWANCPGELPLSDETVDNFLSSSGVIVNGDDKAKQIVANALYDLSMKVGGTKQLRDLLGGSTSINAHWTTPIQGELFPASVSRPDGTIDLYFATNFQGEIQPNNIFDAKAVTVHELAHQIEYFSGEKSCWFFYSLTSGLPLPNGREVPSRVGDGNLSGASEHFASVTTNWVYSHYKGGLTWGSYSKEWFATPEQQIWLEEQLMVDSE